MKSYKNIPEFNSSVSFFVFRLIESKESIPLIMSLLYKTTINGKLRLILVFIIKLCEFCSRIWIQISRAKTYYKNSILNIDGFQKKIKCKMQEKTMNSRTQLLCSCSSFFLFGFLKIPQIMLKSSPIPVTPTLFDFSL